jgi:hypothetical protein
MKKQWIDCCTAIQNSIVLHVIHVQCLPVIRCSIMSAMVHSPNTNICGWLSGTTTLELLHWMIDSVYRFFSNSGLLLFGFIYIVLMSNMIRFHVVQLWYCVVIGRWIHVQFIADIDCTLMWYEWERVWVHVGFDVVLCAINKYILIHT